MFFNGFSDYTRKTFNEDKDKHNVISWLIYNANYQEEYNGLKKRECYFSYSVLEDDCEISRGRLQIIMKELEEEGFIEWINKSKVKHQRSILRLIFQYGKTYSNEYGKQYGSEYGKQYGGIIDSQGLEGSSGMVNNTVNNTVDSTVNNTVNNTSSINISNNKYIVEIVTYLNHVCETSYKPTTKKTITLINARFKEQFTVEDFKEVIDKKAASWKGTDMQKYLRPETLFGTKFEGYLNEQGQCRSKGMNAEVQFIKVFNEEEGIYERRRVVK
ncbi:conserved phage C-terminal domain-containing protein [Cellulosilyticum sp. I15G10I2]|uniref:conserved phage C-terminal domain-containing protein n=1 Tax=Cellulosilyticum sp. I15G10I2 TaxID=1892843 RepID=UPI00085CC43E|nr:conserved phage C-terminal domain-containing protein [Cellulosilyticum sp. I15G10I2]